MKSRSANAKMIEAIRLTGQLSAKNKLGFYYDYQKNCGGSSFTPDGDQCRNRGEGGGATAPPPCVCTAASEVVWPG